MKLTVINGIVHKAETAQCPGGGFLCWAKCAHHEPRRNIKPGSLDTAGYYSSNNEKEVTCLDCRRIK